MYYYLPPVSVVYAKYLFLPTAYIRNEIADVYYVDLHIMLSTLLRRLGWLGFMAYQTLLVI